MIRQAHTYLVSALSGATLIAIAIAAFVVLVSAQVFTDWPIAALGGDDRTAVSDARPVGEVADEAGVSRAGGAAIAAGTVAPRAARSGVARAGGQDGVAVGDRARSASETASSVGSTDTSEAPASSDAASPGAAPGGGSGGGASQPASSAPSSSASSAGGGSGGGGGSAGGGAGGTGGGGTGTGGGSSGDGTSSPSTAGTVTETVNGTVGAVDEKVLGGTLESAGVTGATEGVVEGVAGPESPVGKVVDETVKAVGGLLGGGR